MLSLLKSILWVFPGFFGQLWNPFHIPTIKALDELSCNVIGITVREHTNPKYIKSDLNRIFKEFHGKHTSAEKLLPMIKSFLREFGSSAVFSKKDKKAMLHRLKERGHYHGYIFSLDTSRVGSINSQLRCLSILIQGEDTLSSRIFDYIYETEGYTDFLAEMGVIIPPCEGEDYWKERECNSQKILFHTGNCSSHYCEDRPNKLSVKEFKKFRKLTAKFVDQASKNTA